MIVEARSSKMELRKELTQDITEKKNMISSIRKKLKAVNTIQACVRRQRVEIQSLEKKQKEALDVSSKRQKNVRARKDVVADLCGQLDHMQLSFDEELNKSQDELNKTNDEIVLQKKVSEGLRHELAQATEEITQATEEIVVSDFMF